MQQPTCAISQAERSCVFANMGQTAMQVRVGDNIEWMHDHQKLGNSAGLLSAVPPPKGMCRHTPVVLDDNEGKRLAASELAKSLQVNPVRSGKGNPVQG